MKANKPWIFYDADCGICLKALALARWLAGRGRLEAVPLGSPWARRLFGLGPGEPLTEMKGLGPRRERVGGIDAVLLVARLNPITYPFCWVARIPIGRRLLAAAYRWFARNRACVSGLCRLETNSMRTGR